MTNYYKLKNNTNGKEIFFIGVSNARIELTSTAVKMEYTEASPKDSLSIKLTGQGMRISFDFRMRDSSTDMSNGDSILTATQQRKYLLGEGGDTSSAVLTPGVVDNWTLTLADGETFPIGHATGSVAPSDRNPGVWDGHIDLEVGSV